MAHNSAPGLSTLVDGDAAGHSACDLGVAVMNGGGADHYITFTQVFCVMANGHLNAQFPQMQNSFALVHVGTLDFQACSAQNLSQRAHGNTADTDQMDPLARDQKIVNGTGIVHHTVRTSFQKRILRCGNAESVI